MKMKNSSDKIGVAVEAFLILLIISIIFLSATRILMFAVVEGKSMEPVLQTGDLVFVLKVPTSSIHVGDVVVYRKPSGEFVIHRTIKILNVGDKVVLVTKGDNNLIPDGQVSSQWIVGKVFSVGANVVKIPGVGYLTLCLKSVASDLQHSLIK
ncbi:MAG: signal peptidase I [Desulfurococcales archaeon]|nr:signal peptidase I [Desulfurococcales archaeon]